MEVGDGSTDWVMVGVEVLVGVCVADAVIVAVPVEVLDDVCVSVGEYEMEDV